MNLGARGPGRSAQGLAVGRHCVQPASAPARRSASQRPTARSSASPSMRPGSRRTVASAGRHRFGNSGSGRTPGRSRTDGGASVIHSPTASREAAPARTAQAVSASMTTRACRTPRDREGRAPRPGAPAAPGCLRSWSKASGIGDDASAGTVHPPADIFRLASITSMSVAPCGNCLPWLPPGTTPTAAAVLTWAAPWSSTTAGSRHHAPHRQHHPGMHTAVRHAPPFLVTSPHSGLPWLAARLQPRSGLQHSPLSGWAC
jgi:hypothetical protein